MKFFLCDLGKGNRRAVVIEDRKPFSKNPDLTWSRGWMCGWTPHGLCFSPDHKEDIHDFYVIPFKNIRRDVYCDQVPNLNVRGFGINSVILAKFRAAVDKKQYWQAVVNRYSKNGRRQVISLVARTVFHSLGVNQIEESFQPNQVWLQGMHATSSVEERPWERGGGFLWPCSDLEPVPGQRAWAG